MQSLVVNFFFFVCHGLLNNITRKVVATHAVCAGFKLKYWAWTSAWNQIEFSLF